MSKKSSVAREETNIKKDGRSSSAVGQELGLKGKLSKHTYLQPQGPVRGYSLGVLEEGDGWETDTESELH
jgi:hypothetical protein